MVFINGLNLSKMSIQSREELHSIFGSSINRSPTISVRELASIIGISKEKITDYHFEEWFQFVFISAEQVMDFAKNNNTCCKSKRFTNFMDFHKSKEYFKSKWYCCAMLARFRRTVGGNIGSY
jgi:hypothetical protein